MTVLLSRTTVSGLLDADKALEALRAGFLADSGAVRPQRVRTDLPGGAGTATALIPGLLPGVPAYTVKVNAKFPGAATALKGVVCLHDLADGELLALMDSTAVTAWRTGLSAAIATDALAGPDGTVAVIGAGAQARMVLRGLSRLRTLRRLVVCDADRSRAMTFALDHERALGVPVETVDDPRKAAALATILVTATWSAEPLLDAADVRPGTHVTSLGADEPGKAELGRELLSGARTVVDDRVLAVTSGALGTAGLGPEAADATLSNVLRGSEAGRTSPAEVTVYAPVGLPWQDLALAWPVYRAALDGGDPPSVDLLA